MQLIAVKEFANVKGSSIVSPYSGLTTANVAYDKISSPIFLYCAYSFEYLCFVIIKIIAN